MILNERAYKLGRAYLAELEEDGSPDLAAKVRVEVEAYEQLRDGVTESLEGHVSSLGLILIQTRIARKLTHAQLAQRLGCHEQQIQSYEASRYRSASLERIIEVARALQAPILCVVDLGLAEERG